MTVTAVAAVSIAKMIRPHCEKVGTAAERSNCAVTVLAVPMVSWQGSVPEQIPPLQPMKVEPGRVESGIVDNGLQFVDPGDAPVMVAAEHQGSTVAAYFVRCLRPVSQSFVVGLLPHEAGFVVGYCLAVGAEHKPPVRPRRPRSRNKHTEQKAHT